MKEAGSKLHLEGWGGGQHCLPLQPPFTPLFTFFRHPSHISLRESTLQGRILISPMLNPSWLSYPLAPSLPHDSFRELGLSQSEGGIFPATDTALEVST